MRSGRGHFLSRRRNFGLATPSVFLPRFGGSGGALSSFSSDRTTHPWSSAATWPAGAYVSGNDTTYLSYMAVSSPQTIKVMAVDHTSGAVDVRAVDTQALTDDTHGSPAIVELSDGRLAVFHGPHNGNMEWSISDASGGSPDITDWTRQAAISGSYTYPKPVNIPDGSGGGTLYLIMRKQSVSNYTLVLRSATYTSGGALSFGAETSLVDLTGGSGARVYASEVRATDASPSADIELCATRADSGDTLRANVYYFKYIVSTGAVENIDGSTSTAAGSLPVDLTNANTNYREVDSAGNDTGMVSWCRDANGDLHILYGDDLDGAAAFDVKHNVYDQSAGTWGTAVTVFTAKDRVSGGGFVDNWCLVPLATGGNVEAWYPEGDTNAWSTRGGDNMARKVYSGGAWGSEETIVTGGGSYALGHPTSILNASSAMRVAFTEITQGATDSSADHLNRYAYGDNGFVQWPTLNDPYLYSVCLLMGFNGSDAATLTSDESHWAHLHPITFNGNAQLDTAQQKFGTASLLLDGTGDWLDVPRAQSLSRTEYRLANSDTIELFFRLNETGRAQQLLVTRPSGATSGFMFQITSGNNLQFFGFDSGQFLITGTTTLTAGQWYYAAAQVSADGTTVELFLDGNSEGTDTFAGSPTEGGDLDIGRYMGNTTTMLNGWVDEIRWTKRVLRDVSAVPAAAFPRS